MQKRSSKRQTTDDPNLSAFRVLQHVIRSGETPEKDPLAVELGRRGGLKGGKARAASLSPSKRADIAKKAARARWAKRSR